MPAKNIKTGVSDTGFVLAGVAGFEPTLTVLETVALPLNYTPMLFQGYFISISNEGRACQLVISGKSDDRRHYLPGAKETRSAVQKEGQEVPADPMAA